MERKINQVANDAILDARVLKDHTHAMLVHSWSSFDVKVIISVQGQRCGASTVELAGFGDSQGHLYNKDAALFLVVVV